MESNLAEDQFGFRNNCGTREAILGLKFMIEMNYAVYRPLFIGFVTLENVFFQFLTISKLLTEIKY